VKQRRSIHLDFEVDKLTNSIENVLTKDVFATDVHFVRSDEKAVVKGLGYTLLTFVAGWWGIPWGPIYSIGCLSTNLSGGKDVTGEMMKMMDVQALVS